VYLVLVKLEKLEKLVKLVKLVKLENCKLNKKISKKTTKNHQANPAVPNPAQNNQHSRAVPNIHHLHLHLNLPSTLQGKSCVRQKGRSHSPRGSQSEIWTQKPI